MNGIDKAGFAVKNYWNRYGRARSGFDERVRGDKTKLKTGLLPSQKTGYQGAAKGKGKSAAPPKASASVTGAGVKKSTAKSRSVSPVKKAPAASKKRSESPKKKDPPASSLTKPTTAGKTLPPTTMPPPTTPASTAPRQQRAMDNPAPSAARRSRPGAAPRSTWMQNRTQSRDDVNAVIDPTRGRRAKALGEAASRGQKRRSPSEEDDDAVEWVGTKRQARGGEQLSQRGRDWSRDDNEEAEAIRSAIASSLETKKVDDELREE